METEVVPAFTVTGYRGSAGGSAGDGADGGGDGCTVAAAAFGGAEGSAGGGAACGGRVEGAAGAGFAVSVDSSGKFQVDEPAAAGACANARAGEPSETKTPSVTARPLLPRLAHRVSGIFRAYTTAQGLLNASRICAARQRTPFRRGLSQYWRRR